MASFGPLTPRTFWSRRPWPRTGCHPSVSCPEPGWGDRPGVSTLLCLSYPCPWGPGPWPSPLGAAQGRQVRTQASSSYVWDSDSVIAVVNPPGRSHCEGPQPGGGTRRPKGRISSLLLETAEHPCDMAGHGRAASQPSTATLVGVPIQAMGPCREQAWAVGSAG